MESYFAIPKKIKIHYSQYKGNFFMKIPSGLRQIAFRHKGETHGPITRLVSPGDIGEMIKPFVFLDYVNATIGPGFGFHPHSGIATLTHPLTFDLEHEASSGQIDTVKEGGVEWVVAGGGIWHRSKVLRGEPVQGFQLWFALPPTHESMEPSTQFISPEEVPKSGPVSILLGEYESKKSLIKAPIEANCYLILLKGNEEWTYNPPGSHNVAWAFLQKGQIQVNGQQLSQELVVFEEGKGALRFHAVEESRLLFGSAAKHKYPLVLGSHSVHTSGKALENGKKRINEIGQRLRQEGKLI